MKTKKINIKNKLLIISIILSRNFYITAMNELDTTFGPGNNGTVTTNIDDENAQIYNINLQSDNKIVGIGYGGDSNSQFALGRYTTGGILDTSFGSNGIVLTTIDVEAQAFAGGINGASGTIIAGGFAYDNISTKFALTRYSSTGGLDASFGTAGIVKTLVGDGSTINAIALDTNKNIVAGGEASISGNGLFAVARYLAADGSLDTTGFNPGGSQPGTVTTQIQIQAVIHAITIQSSDGKIVAGGFSKNVSTNNQFALARYNPDGSLDTSGFNSGGSQPGTIVTPIGNGDQINGIAIDGSGNVVAAGFATISGLQQFAVARYTSAGVLDTGFATSGIFTTDISNFANGAAGTSIAVQSDGKIVIGGYTNDPVALFAVIRLNSNGTLDSTFGTGGIETVMVQDFAQANSILIQPDGKIVAGGLAFSNDTNLNSFALARLNRNNTDFITITSIANGSTILTRTPTVAGTASATGAEVDVLIDSSLFTTGTISATGAWNVGNTNILSNGTHVIQSNLLVSGIKIADYAVDFNVNANDFITITTPTHATTIGGNTTAINGSSNLISKEVLVFLDGIFFGSTTTDNSGNWSVSSTGTLSSGTHVIEAIIINSAGNLIADSFSRFIVS